MEALSKIVAIPQRQMPHFCETSWIKTESLHCDHILIDLFHTHLGWCTEAKCLKTVTVQTFLHLSITFKRHFSDKG